MTDPHRLVVYALALAACNTDESPPSTTPPPGITGAVRVFHWSVDGQPTAVGEDPSKLFIEAQIPGAEVVDVRPAQIADDASFTIDGPAPTGRYWLRLVDGHRANHDLYIYTDATELDLGHDLAGDADLPSRIQDTKLVVDASGLDPWQDTDETDFVMPDIGYVSAGVSTFYASNGPVAGDAALDVRFRWVGLPTTPPASSPRAWFVQLRPAHDDALNLDYVAPIRSFEAGPVSLVDGGLNQIDGTFASAPPLDVPLAWSRSSFAAQADAMHPPAFSAELGNQLFWVHAAPGHAAHGELAFLLDESAIISTYAPRVVDGVTLEDTTDLAGTLHAANPYPADWLYANYEMDFDVLYRSPFGGPQLGVMEASIGVITAGIATAPVAPLVGPPRSPQIEGRDLTFAQPGVGAVPTISWTAPAIGTPTSYEIHIFEVVPRGLGSISFHEDATLYVPADTTSVALPRAVLTDGVVYVAQIRAISRGGQQLATAPFRAGMPLGYADLVTSFFQP